MLIFIDFRLILLPGELQDLRVGVLLEKSEIGARCCGLRSLVVQVAGDARVLVVLVLLLRFCGREDGDLFAQIESEC